MFSKMVLFVAAAKDDQFGNEYGREEAASTKSYISNLCGDSKGH